MQRNNVKLISMDTIPIEEVKWLLYPFIPLGKITILQGDPGEGKTTLALQIIAALTTGKPVWECRRWSRSMLFIRRLRTD